MRSGVALSFFIMFAISILSLTSTSPVASTEEVEDTTPVMMDDVHPTVGVLSNGSKIVITNVVKTVEFDVALESEFDGSSTNPDESTPSFIETDIKILDPDLLDQVVSALAQSRGTSSTQKD